MPTFEADLSDGRTITFEADQEPSHDELLAAVNSHPMESVKSPAFEPALAETLKQIQPPSVLNKPTENAFELTHWKPNPDAFPMSPMPDAAGPEPELRGLSFRERARMSPFGRAVAGPTQEEQEQLPGGKLGGQVTPVDIANTMVNFTKPGVPPIADAVRTVTDPILESIPAELPAVTGALRGARELALNFPLAPFGEGLAGKAALLGFTADWIRQQPNAYREFKKAIDNGETEKAAEIATSDVGGGILLGLGAKHAMKGESPAEAMDRILKKAKDEESHLDQPQHILTTAESAPSLVTEPTTKGETQNAVPIRSPETVPVAQAPGYSQEVGARVSGTGTEKSADAQGQEVVAQGTGDVPAQEVVPPRINPDTNRPFYSDEDYAKYKALQEQLKAAPDMAAAKPVQDQWEALKNKYKGVSPAQDDIPPLVQAQTRVDAATVEMGKTKIGDDNYLKARKELKQAQADLESEQAKASAKTVPETNPLPEQGPRTVAAKALADRFREQFKTQGVTLSTFGPIPKLIDAAVEIAAKIIEAGGKVADAVEAAIAHIKANHTGDWNEGKVRDQLVKLFDQSGADTTGIAHRVSEQRGVEAERGVGISAPDSAIHGRDLLAKGADPEKVITDFNQTKRISADDIAIARAHDEVLARATNQAIEQHGVGSPEHLAAWQAEKDWIARVKPMQTEWHKIGQAQQGETEVDTGTFHGLQREHFDQTGKDFTPDQEKVGKKVAKGVGAAGEASDKAKNDLFRELDKTDPTKRTKAEQDALDAAHKTVRENAIRLAEAEKKSNLADVERDQKVKAIRDAAEKKAADAVAKTLRERAARAAAEENQKRVNASQADNETRKVQELARQRAEDSANKAVRDNAIREATEETKKAVADASRKKAVAEIERARSQKALDASNERAKKLAMAQAESERKALADPAKQVWDKVREYTDKGEDNLDDIRNKVATDLGIPVKRVTDLLLRNKRAKFLADEAWRRQQDFRSMKDQAKRWLTQIQTPGYRRVIESIPKVMFGLKVGFHGTVALGTHAPMVFFQPRFWNTYVKNFGRMYRMVGSKAYYEHQVQDLLRRPNYTIARRSGLVNDPFTFEDFNSPDTAKYFGNLTGMGNRGYAVLKILRQDMFDQMWSKLPKTMKYDEVAEAVSDGLNHATGVVKGSAPTGANLALFAPRLLASRVAWLAVDPVRALESFATWKSATPAEKQFAINQVKEKAWVAGTLFGILAINQGLLSATGDKQKINFDDPMKSDFLKFKVAGMTVSYGNAMLSMARLPVRLYQIRESNGGKLRNLIYPDESTYSVLGEYARSQMSPFASLATDLWMKGDWQNRPLPNSERPVPKRLRAQGVEAYTWPEFWAEKVVPIPVEEAMREVWKKGLGMSPEQVSNMEKAMATIAVMGATGARITEDPQAKP